MKEEARLQITDERVRLSQIVLTIKDVLAERGFTQPATVTLAMRSADLAKMWLGKALYFLGAPNPHPESRNSENKIIEKTADEAEAIIIFEALDPPINEEIGAIKYLRKLLTQLEKDILNDLDILKDQPLYQIAITNAYTFCTNATIWLGVTLGEIREASEPKELTKELAAKEEKAVVAEAATLPDAGTLDPGAIPPAELAVAPAAPKGKKSTNTKTGK